MWWGYAGDAISMTPWVRKKERKTKRQRKKSLCSLCLNLPHTHKHTPQPHQRAQQWVNNPPEGGKECYRLQDHFLCIFQPPPPCARVFVGVCCVCEGEAYTDQNSSQSSSLEAMWTTMEPVQRLLVVYGKWYPSLNVFLLFPPLLLLLQRICFTRFLLSESGYAGTIAHQNELNATAA